MYFQVSIDLWAPMAYNVSMEQELIPQVVVETPAYLQSVKKFWSQEVQNEFKEYIGLNPLAGDVIPGLGGIRKIRWQGSGRGRRGGARVIYYVYNEDFPIYLFFAYAKNAQTDLTEDEKEALRKAAASLKSSFQRREKHHG